MTDVDDPREETLWEAGWEGHETAQRRRLAALPLAEKLRLVEDMLVLALRLDAARSEAQKKQGG